MPCHAIDDLLVPINFFPLTFTIPLVEAMRQSIFRVNPTSRRLARSLQLPRSAEIADFDLSKLGVAAVCAGLAGGGRYCGSHGGEEGEDGEVHVCDGAVVE